MAGGTYTPSGSTQTVSCSGKKMTSNVVINPIPSNYVNVKANQTVFNNGVCSICTRIYPYYVNSSNNYYTGTSIYASSTAVNGYVQNAYGYNNTPGGAAGTSTKPIIPIKNLSVGNPGTYGGSWLLLDGSFLIDQFSKISINVDIFFPSTEPWPRGSLQLGIKSIGTSKDFQLSIFSANLPSVTENLLGKTQNYTFSGNLRFSEQYIKNKYYYIGISTYESGGGITYKYIATYLKSLTFSN